MLDRLKTWSPTNQQLLTLSIWIFCSGKLLDLCIKGAVLLAVGYFAGEGITFLLHAMGGR